MKNFSVKGVLGTIKRRPTGSPNTSNDPQGETPEAIAARSIRAFIEAGGAENAGDEVTYLPTIVDAAESSPAAAAECARLIRKYLNKDYWSRPSYQYNAIMVMRILADNPGMTFTRNADKKFVETCKELLRTGRDPSVRQMLMETLDSFEQTKEYDEGLTPLVDMWKKEKEKAYKAYGGRPAQSSRNHNGGGGNGPGPQPQQFDPHSQNYFSRSHSNRRLPDPVELANRLEEARTSAKLLTQVVQCTAPSEVLTNDLIREFADRCLSASRSIQGYMNARDPSPDNDTMESMIDTNEQLQQALNLHQRAVLNAKKTLGINSERNSPSPVGGPPPPGPPPVNGAARAGGSGSGSGAVAPQLPAREGKGKGTAAEDLGLGALAIGGSGGSAAAAAAAGPSRSTSGTPRPEEDPFRDPQPESSRSSSRARPPGGGAAGSSSAAAAAAAATATGGWDETEQKVMMPFEPFHPGGFDAKPAYARRQESAVNNLTMRGAAEGGSALDADEGAAAAGKSRADSTYDDDRDDDEERSKSKQPMYRY